jgi:hypothetical protein
MAKPKPIITFKAKISAGSKLYYSVHLFSTLSEMREFAASKAETNKAYYHGTVAACCYWNYPKPYQNKLGDISFCAKTIATDTIAHECVHAALGALDRKGIKSIETAVIGSPNAEELCHITDFLFYQIQTKLKPAS